MTYQARIGVWMSRVFALEVTRNRAQRALRFLEEAIELAQAIDLDEEQAVALVRYVYARPVGSAQQEVGGVMVTLAALCNALDVDLLDEAEREAGRIEQPEVIARIQRRQTEKRAQGFAVDTRSKGKPQNG